jgi:hypothetical protein
MKSVERLCSRLVKHDDGWIHLAQGVSRFTQALFTAQKMARPKALQDDKLRRIDAVPQRTVKTMKENMTWAKKQIK